MIRYVRALWRNLFQRDRVDEELDEEIRSYLELTAMEQVRRGLSPEDAVRKARRDLGQIDQIKDGVRDVRAGIMVDTLVQDLRYALRTLGRSPAFSSVVVLTVAFGIAANTAIFTIVDGVLLKPLPYAHPDRLVMLWERSLTDGTLGTVAPANFFDWRQQGHSFDAMAAVDPHEDVILTGSGEPRRLLGAAVTAEFFPVLGVGMALGRTFLAEEDRPGHNRVVVLSHAVWLNQFGGRPDILGHVLTLNDAPFTVVGVLPRDFSLVSRASDLEARHRFDLWTPLALESPPPAWQRGTHSLTVFARLKPAAALTQAQMDLDAVAANLRRLYPADDANHGIAAVPMAQHVVVDVRTALLTLLAAVGMVLAIACANIANLLLTRAATRRKEIALRVALGASRRRIARQLVTESAVLTITGGMLGLLLTSVSLPLLVNHLPADLPRTSEIGVDTRVLVFTSALSLLTGLVFGLVPLVYSRGISATDALKQGSWSVAGGRSRVRSALLVAQVAVALMLLVGAGLMMKSLWRLWGVSPGFHVDHILTTQLSLPPQYANGNSFGTGKHPRIAVFQRELGERVRAIPGVQAAAFAAYLPLGGTDNSWAFDIEGRPPRPPGIFDIANYRPVTAGYFETMGIPLRRGRAFDSGDGEDRPLVVIVNETMAREFWDRQDPVGQRLRFGDHSWRTIVGVVGDVHHRGLGATPAAELYVPYAQVPNVEVHPTLVMRTSTDPETVVRALQKAVADVDPTVPMDQIQTMNELVADSVAQSRFRTTVLLMFAGVALLVAAMGLYGAMSYSVSQRTQEFGVRMAVGASRSALLRLVLGQATRLVIVGICLGLAGSVLLSRLIASLLYGVAPFDVGTLAGVSVLLVSVALMASYVPAHRAARADPMKALRWE